MKKQFLLAKTLMMLAFTGALSWGSLTSVYAQAPNSYSFAQTSATFSPLVGGTNSTAAGDDGTQTGIAIGFDFSYNGTTMTQFGVTTNGAIRLGTSAATTSPVGFTNNLVTTVTNTLAVLWDDNNGSAGTISYLTTGSAPNRVLTVSWQNVSIGGGGSTANSTNSYQIQLFETTNVIQFQYGSLTAANGISASIGITGANGNYISVTPGAPATFSSAAANNAINSVANLASGTVYTFSPPSCIAPSGLNAGLVSTTEGNFSWNAANPVPGVGYEYAITTSATPPVSGTPTAGLSFNDNTLTASTAYWLHVRSECSAGVYSAWSTLSFNTTPGLGCALPVVVSAGAYTYPTLGTGANTSACFTAGTSGYWYSYTPAEDGFMTVKSCGTTDTRLSILSGTCSSLTCVAQNDDDSDLACHPSGYASSVVDLPVVGGTTYFIHWNNQYTNASSNWTLSFTPPIPAPSCASNFVITPTPGCDNEPLTISWDATPTASGYIVSLGTTPGGNEIANNQDLGNVLTVDFLDPSLNTTYYYTVTPYNIGGDAIGCVEQQFTTGSSGCLCVPTYLFGKTDGDLISNVVIPGTTLSNNTGTAQVNPAYTYFTGPSNTADLVQGGSYNVTISVGTWGSQGIRAWIDYNDDNVFDDSESIGATTVAPGLGFNASGYAPAVFNVNLSNSAPLGTHRMRIRSAYFIDAATLNPCIEYNYGETEDYDVTIVAPVTTSLNSAACGASNVALDQALFAGLVGQPAYRFRVTGNNNASWVNNQLVIDRTVRWIKFVPQVPGAITGETYDIEVAVGDGFGNFGPYSSVCPVTLTAAQPTTQLSSAACGAINVDPVTALFANQVFGAQGYRFRISGANTGAQGWVNDQFILTRTERWFKFAPNVPGFVNGETYDVEVAVLLNDGVTYGPYGTLCEVTLSGTPNLVLDENEISMSDKSLVEVVFGANASHNPFTTAFGLQVLNANDSETINVVIYDMSGKLIERHAVNPMDIEVATFGSNLASGMYMVEVRQGANQAVIRQVKN